jgi:hypothetical protein
VSISQPPTSAMRSVLASRSEVRWSSTFPLVVGPVLLDEVDDPVEERLFLVRMQILRDIRRDRVLSELLAAAISPEDERQRGVVLADGFEQLDPINVRQVVIDDDTVDVAVDQLLVALGTARGCLYLDRRVRFGGRPNQLGEAGAIGNVEDSNWLHSL